MGVEGWWAQGGGGLERWEACVYNTIVIYIYAISYIYYDIDLINFKKYQNFVVLNYIVIGKIRIQCIYLIFKFKNILDNTYNNKYIE